MFTLFIIAIAVFWAGIGVMIARWLKQAGYNKPFTFKGKNLNLYGGGQGFGARPEWNERDDGRILIHNGGRDVRMGMGGGGRVKGI
jgi:hypothetical protein